MAKKSTKTPMAVDKSNTPVWMKTVILVLVVTFGVGGVAIAAAGSGLFGGSTTPDAPGTSGGTINAEYQPRADAALAAAAASPDNPDILIQVGHAYFDWARAVYESGQVQTSIPTWLAAVSFYDQTLALDPGNDIALGNKAFALFYAGDRGAADALRAFIEGAADNADLAGQVDNARTLLADLETAPAGETAPAPPTP